MDLKLKKSKEYLGQQLKISEDIIERLVKLGCKTVSDIMRLGVAIVDDDGPDLKTCKAISECKEIWQAQVTASPELLNSMPSEDAATFHDIQMSKLSPNKSINFIRVFCYLRDEVYPENALNERINKFEKILGFPFFEKDDMLEINLLNTICVNPDDLDTVVFSVTLKGLLIGEIFIPFSNISHLTYRTGAGKMWPPSTRLWPTYEFRKSQDFSKTA